MNDLCGALIVQRDVSDYLDKVVCLNFVMNLKL